MSPALDSTIPVFSIPEATGAWGDEEHSCMALEGKLPGSNTFSRFARLSKGEMLWILFSLFPASW
jgi:hypothetical protein